MDITPNAVEKLNYAQLYPIVVFLEAQSKAVVKDLRGKLATSDEERKKKPGKLYDRGVKLQRGYGHVFTGDESEETASFDPRALPNFDFIYGQLSNYCNIAKKFYQINQHTQLPMPDCPNIL